MWAHDTSNHSTWQVADINSGSGNSYPGTDPSFPGNYVYSLLVGDTIYFRATNSTSPNNYEIWAHDTSNHSTWQVTDNPSSSFARYMFVLIDDTIYLNGAAVLSGNSGYSSGTELWAIQPAEITSLPPPPNMTDVTGATCGVSPALPTGCPSTAYVHHQRYTSGGLKQHDLHGHCGHQQWTYQTTVWLSPQPTTHAER